ncbi:MAG: hypothetical protein R3C26_19875 [Calditrichia bacterium]
MTPESQIKINRKRNQSPEYRDVKQLILRKSKSLCKDLSLGLRLQLSRVAESAYF